MSLCPASLLKAFEAFGLDFRHSINLFNQIKAQQVTISSSGLTGLASDGSFNYCVSVCHKHHLTPSEDVKVSQ